MEATTQSKRTGMTLMLDPEVRRKLRLAAANKDTKMSDIANDALRAALGLQRDAPPKPAA